MKKWLLDGACSVNRRHNKCRQAIRRSAAIIGRQVGRLIHRAYPQLILEAICVEFTVEGKTPNAATSGLQNIAPREFCLRTEFPFDT